MNVTGIMFKQFTVESTDGHPSSKELENYALGKTADCADLECHLIVCGQCRAEVEEEEHFADVLRKTYAVGRPEVWPN